MIGTGSVGECVRRHVDRASVRATVEATLARIEAASDNAWICVHTIESLEPLLQRLDDGDPAALPLFGVPFAVKDNIDVADLPTTAACPDFAYRPALNATVVSRLVDAGAIPIGKTNMDQFATGLVGTRTPHGPARNTVRDDLVPGGSSSGSAVAVASGVVPFALGTDTAGSGRVPAAFNGIWGIKPTNGWLSTRGVVPACRTLDCVSVFAADPQSARTVLEIAAQRDPDDPFARDVQSSGFALDGLRVGIADVDQLQLTDTGYAESYERSLAQMAAQGVTLVELDISPFLEAATMLYDGPWVAERYAAVGEFIETHPRSVEDVTRSIILGGRDPDAVSTFRARYRLAELKLRADQTMRDVDCLALPTTPTVPTLAAVAADPMGLNSELGRFTNFMNLLDYAGVALPGPTTIDGRPFGLTLCGRAGSDGALIAAGAFLIGQELDQTDIPGRMDLVVCGAHMSKMALNHELVGLGGFFRSAVTTSAVYRLFALAGDGVKRPGLVRSTDGGRIQAEVWSLPIALVGRFLDGIPSPLGLGRVELDDGRWLTGFICEPWGLDGAQDITTLGSWREFVRVR